ncbi:MAG: diadenosine tetraphosphatase ApaH/serine/threonine PP2A family protein phosphatase [Kiritimatiellia bacterium]|jgi:diadenosine tetraphosphatase ApaH/serine/threonine PP2A family protein phosphatase
MKYAILGDIHANLEALNRVLEDAHDQGCTHFLSIGDMVGYNANPVECLQIIQDMKCPVVRGNHDHYCSQDDELPGFHPMAAEVINWTRDQLPDHQKEFLRGLPYTERVETFTIVHSTLDNPDKWGYVLDRYDAEANFNYQNTAVCFYGHTHIPIAFEKGDDIRSGLYSRIKIKMGRKYFINVGSVGQPRDGDPRSAYCIFDMVNNMIELRRLEYDMKTTQEKIRAAGLPEKVATRLAIGR